MNKGFSLLELLIVVAIIGIVMAIMVPMMDAAMLRAHVGAMASDSKAVHVAFKRFFIDNNMYPNSSGSPVFDLATFEPLVSEGYYDGRILSKLDEWEADGYDSPDDQGTNQEFWIEFTLRADTSVRFLVSDSDNAPLAGGDYKDGIFLYRYGVNLPFNAPIDRQ